MIQALEGLIARDGTLAEPLRQGIVAPTSAELEGWSELPSGADELAEAGARPKDDRAADDFYRRTFAEPSLDVNGIVSGRRTSRRRCCRSRRRRTSRSGSLPVSRSR